MNATQQRYLLNRLDEAKRTKPSYYDDVKMAEPAEVKRARQQAAKAKVVIDRWEKAKRKVADSRRDKISLAFNRAKSAVMFKESGLALKAIEAFEEMKF